MRGVIILLFLIVVFSITSCATSYWDSYCLIDDFEGYTVVQWYLHNGAKYSFSNDSISGDYSIKFSFDWCTHDSVHTQYYPVDERFSIGLYFKPLNHWSVAKSPLYITFDMVEAKVIVKWWFENHVKHLLNGSYLHTYYFKIRVTAENTSHSKYMTINYETRQEIPEDLHFTKYRPTKWVHILVSYYNHNLTITAANKTLSITVKHDPPSVKLSIYPSCHYGTGVLIDRLEICGIKSPTWTSQRNTIVIAATAGFLGGLLSLLLLESSSRKRRVR